MVGFGDLEGLFQPKCFYVLCNVFCAVSSVDALKQGIALSLGCCLQPDFTPELPRRPFYVWERVTWANKSAQSEVCSAWIVGICAPGWSAAQINCAENRGTGWTNVWQRWPLRSRTSRCCWGCNIPLTVSCLPHLRDWDRLCQPFSILVKPKGEAMIRDHSKLMNLMGAKVCEWKNSDSCQENAYQFVNAVVSTLWQIWCNKSTFNF